MDWQLIDFLKLPSNNFDIVYLPETFLDSSISNDENRIDIAVYSLIRADHPSNKIKGGVCIGDNIW